MKSIRIHSGGYFNDIPVDVPEIIGQNIATFVLNDDLLDAKKNLIDPKMNAVKLLNLVQFVAKEYKEEIDKLDEEEKKIQKEIDALQFISSDLETYNKMKEIRGLESRISKFSSSSSSVALPKKSKGAKGPKEDTLESLTEKLNLLRAEFAKLKQLSEEEIAIFQKRDTLEELKRVPKEAKETKIDMLQRIEKYMDESLDEDKLKCEIAKINKNIKDIQSSLDKNERYELFNTIIDYMNKNPDLHPDEKKPGAFVNKAQYPGQETIRCEDLSGKGLGWFVSQKNKMTKEAGLDNEQKKLTELTDKLRLIGTITKVDINESTFNTKLDKYFYLIDKISKQLNYDEVFNALVGFSTWNVEMFSSLYEIDIPTGRKKNFIIVEEYDSNFYEIFRSAEIITLPEDNVFIFNRDNFVFTSGNTIITNMSQIKNKIILYPAFYNTGSNFSGSMIDGLILYSKINNLPNYTRYYKNLYNEERFLEWLNRYCALGEGDRQHIYFTAPSPFITFIISHSFDTYFKILEDCDFSIQVEDYNPDYITKEYFKKIDEVKMNEEYSTIDADFGIIDGKTNDNKITNLLRKYIASKQDISIETIIYILSKLENKHSYNNIVFRAITIIEKLQGLEETLTNTYNFTKLNHLYNLFKNESFKKDNKFKDTDEELKFSKKFKERLDDLNTYINYSKNQIFALFFVDLLNDYIYFTNLYVYDIKELEKKYKQHKVYIKIKECLLSLVCSFYYYLIYNDAKIPKLINYRIQFSKFDKTIPVNDSSISIGTRIRDLKGRRDLIGDKTNLLTAYQLILGGKIEGFVNHSFRDDALHHNFADPRGVSTDPEIGIGRPMCGEVTILNFLNFLLFNKTTKQIDYTYLPDITKTNNAPLVAFYTKYNDINKYNSDVDLINEFFNFYKHMPFEIISTLDDKVTDSDYNYDSKYGWCVYKYNTQKTVGSKTFIDEGIELRCTYFNLLRVLSYLLKLEAPLDFRNIEANFSNDAFLINALKQIVLLFKNPDIQNIVSEYSVDKPAITIPLNVTFKGCYLMLGRHSEFHLIKSSKFSDIQKYLRNYNTIFNNKLRFSKGVKSYDLYSSVFLSTMKDNVFYSQIDFKSLDENEIIKFINILDPDFENLYISPRIIKTVFEEKKYKLLKVLFNKFMFSRESFYLYFKNLLDEDGNIDEIIESYFVTNKRLTRDIITLFISKNRKDIISNLISCGKIDMFSLYDFHEIKDKEMFSILNSVISSKTVFEQSDYYYRLISPYFEIENTIEYLLPQLNYLSNSVFVKLAKKIQFIKNMAEKYKFNNLEIIFKKMIECGIDLNKYILAAFDVPGFFLAHVYKYSTLLIIKKYWREYSTYEHDNSLGSMVAQALYKLVDQTSTIQEMYDSINLLCYIAEINEKVFMSRIVDNYSTGIKINNNLGIIVNTYFMHLFYNKFSKIVSSNILLCIPICLEYIYRLRNEIIEYEFKKESDEDRILMRKMIAEYSNLYIENKKIYEQMLIDNVDSTNYYTIGLIKIDIDMNVFGRKKGDINPKLLIKIYEKQLVDWYDMVTLNDGSDELTNYIMSNILNTKIYTIPPITTFKSDKLRELRQPNYVLLLINSYFGYTATKIKKLSQKLSKLDSKYTTKYIAKNLMKTFNYALTFRSYGRPIKFDFTKKLSSLIKKISIEESIFIKCLKSLITNKYYGDLTYPLNGYNIDSIKALFDRKVKTLYYFKHLDETIESIKTKDFKIIIDDIANDDLKEISKTLGLH